MRCRIKRYCPKDKTWTFKCCGTCRKECGNNVCEYLTLYSDYYKCPDIVKEKLRLWQVLEHTSEIISIGRWICDKTGMHWNILSHRNDKYFTVCKIKKQFPELLTEQVDCIIIKEYTHGKNKYKYLEIELTELKVSTEEYMRVIKRLTVPLECFMKQKRSDNK